MASLDKRILGITAAALLAGAAQTMAQAPLVFNNGAMFFVNGGPNGQAIVYVDGTVQHEDSLLINLGQFTIKGDFVNNSECGGDGSGTLQLPGNNGHFIVHGDWINNGEYRAGSGQVTFMEDGDITGSSVTQFNILTLDDQVVRTQVDIDAEISVTGRLDLNRGELNTMERRMTVFNPNVAAITRFNNCYQCGFVSSFGDGKLARHTNQNSDYLFPVGSSYVAVPGTSEVRYRPVIIRPETSAADVFAVRFANVNPSPFGLPIDQTDASLCYVNPYWYHRIAQEGGANASASLAIAFDPQIGSDPDFNTITYWNQVTQQWENTNFVSSDISGFFERIVRLDWNGYLTHSDNYALAYQFPQQPQFTGSDALCASVEEVYTVPDNGSNYLFQVENGTIVSQTQNSVTVIWENLGQGTLNITETVPNTINGGCTSPVGTYYIQIYPLPEAIFTADQDPTLIANGGGIFIHDILHMNDASTLTEQWEWDFGDGNTSTAPAPYHSYDAVGTYTIQLIATSIDGCKDTLENIVNVVEGIIIPNVFTPNNDGFNDEFNVRTSDVGLFRLQIYNRWGEVVFETTAPEINWDGRNRAGAAATAGTYYFVISRAEMRSGNTIDSEQANFQDFRESGWLQLLR